LSISNSATELLPITSVSGPLTDREELTLSVPEAASRYFGLGKNAAYAAAARGEIPTIKIGRLLRVPVRALERMLERASEPGA
jgi:excisionase family DNA binding protein